MTLKEGARASDDELIDHVRGRLARFKSPKRVVFGPLPKTSTGKVQKKTLRELSFGRSDHGGRLRAFPGPARRCRRAIRAFIADEVIPLEADAAPHAARARPRTCAGS